MYKQGKFMTANIDFSPQSQIITRKKQTMNKSYSLKYYLGLYYTRIFYKKPLIRNSSFVYISSWIYNGNYDIRRQYHREHGIHSNHAAINSCGNIFISQIAKILWRYDYVDYWSLRPKFLSSYKIWYLITWQVKIWMAR